MEISNGYVFVLRMWIGYLIDMVIFFILKYKNCLVLDKLMMGFFMYIFLFLLFFIIFVFGYVELDIDFLMLLFYFKVIFIFSVVIFY